MTGYDALLFAIAMLGAFNAGLLTLLWFTPDRRRVLPDYWPFPALTALAGLVTLVIGADHAGLAPRLSGLEWALGAVSGPLLLHAVRRACGLNTPRLVYGFAPLIFLAAVFIAPRFEMPSIAAIVAAQWSFTAGAALSWGRATTRPPARRAASLLLVCFALVHLAQALRMAFPDAMRDLVPLSLALAFVGLTTFLLLRSRALGGWFRPVDPSAAADAAIGRLETWLREGDHHRRSDLRLAEAAAAIEVAPGQLSRWLNDRGRSFGDVLTQARLEDAARLLRDPNEARTSIEAIGLMVGFASRSGFYKAFTKQFANSPAAYRRAQISV